jgi:hypothetical protein
LGVEARLRAIEIKPRMNVLVNPGYIRGDAPFPV